VQDICGDLVALPTLGLEHPNGRAISMNFVVVASASLRCMIELEFAVGGDELGRQLCDAITCSTPPPAPPPTVPRTAGRRSMWDLEATALSYVAAHGSARPPTRHPAASGSDRVDTLRRRPDWCSRRWAPPPRSTRSRQPKRERSRGPIGS
jgi:hypothetical protein